MTDHETTLPERLRAEGATGLERRLLDAASRERPSRGATERMARALGVAPPAIGGAPATPGGGESMAPPGVGAGGAAWFPGAIIALAVGGVAVGGAIFLLRPEPVSAPLPGPAPSVEASRVSPRPKTESGNPGVASDEPEAPNVAPAAPRAKPSASVGDLGEQIALLDSARAAMSSGSGERALELLQRYLAKYPTGSFRPEATALKIETLVNLGRKAEARSLAERFVAAQRGSPLANRVQRLTGTAAR